MTNKPSGLLLRNGVWHLDCRINGLRLRGTTGTSDLDEAIRIMNERRADYQRLSSKKVWSDKVKAEYWKKESWFNRTLRKTKQRGEESGKGCSITRDEFLFVLLRSNGFCEVSGIPFSDDKPDGSTVSPWQQSIDRIDASRGYHLDNIRIVCFAVNVAMREWGEDVLMRISQALVMKWMENQVSEWSQNACNNRDEKKPVSLTT